MKTELGIIRGSNEEEVKSKKFNIYLGISLGNKWFTKENMKEYVHWALKYTKERVGILIADTLHAINYEVRNRKSFEKSIKKALEEGNRFEKIFLEIIKELPIEERKRIDLIRWDDIEKAPFSKKFTPFLQEEFEKNERKKDRLTIRKGYGKEIIATKIEAKRLLKGTKYEKVLDNYLTVNEVKKYIKKIKRNSLPNKT